MDIQVGQYWKTRSGKIVRVSADRLLLDERNTYWRWALSNSEIADPDGRVSVLRKPGTKKPADHPSDLLQLIDKQ